MVNLINDHPIPVIPRRLHLYLQCPRVNTEGLENAQPPGCEAKLYDIWSDITEVL